ncbi:MAG: putative iron-regulated protein [Crocinitomicaceae bacterium]|jgi:putative iron-regulated protein
MNLTKMASAIALSSLLIACGSSSNDNSSSAINVDNVQKVLDTNADIAFATYSDSLTTAELLKTALATFKATPNDANLVAAKKAWLVSREPYGQTEVYRFRNSPIDSTDYSSENGPEGDINAWPLGEALIDYVETNATDFTAGEVGVTTNTAEVNGNGVVDGLTTTQNIIGNTSITINADLLSNTASAEDGHDVIAGYHAIEFMLWGQDLNTSNQTATDGTDRINADNSTSAGGQRPLSDFQYTDINDNTELSVRRHAFLEVAADKLIADLESVLDGWKDNVDGNYRDQFTTISNTDQAKQKLTEILTGMGTLSEGELAGERMQIALVNNSQEDEHSCFSDNTHRDIWLNAEGVSNSFYGDYTGYDGTQDGVDNVTTNAVSGYGIDDYLSDAGLNSLSTQVAEALNLTKTNYMAIDTSARNGSPFDVLIQTLDANGDVAKTIISLNSQANLINDIAEELGLGNVVDNGASDCDTSSPTSGC